MTVEVLYFEGCPSYERVLPRVRELAAARGAELVLRRVETAEAAEKERFLGSPTIRVDGRDVEPEAAERTDYGMKCRIYRRGASQAGVPPDELLVAALT